MAVLRNIFFIIIFFSFLSGPLLPSGKKIRVIAEKANIYFEADKNSPIVETVEKGTILTLQETGKVKKIWLHVYFASEESGMTISGYILDSLVERLFVVTKIVTIKGEDEETYYKHINTALNNKPQLTVDDGADLVWWYLCLQYRLLDVVDAV
mgnify:CR=1 FL=1